jgi:uncharacterized protein YktA (UPF0223 family)
MQVDLTESAVRRIIELLEKTESTYDQRIANKLKEALRNYRPAIGTFDLDDIPF